MLRRRPFPASRIAVLALALVVLARAMVPAGFMLAPSESGAFTIELCSGQGGQYVAFDPETGQWVPADAPSDTDDQPDHSDDGAAGLCAFASAPLSAVAPDFPAPAAPRAASLPAPPPPAHAPPAAAPVPGPLPARGPPLSA